MPLHKNTVESGVLSVNPRRRDQILAAYDELGAATDCDICKKLGFYPDLNKVRPEITRLVQEGVLIEVADRLDPITRVNVRVCRRVLA